MRRHQPWVIVLLTTIASCSNQGETGALRTVDIDDGPEHSTHEDARSVSDVALDGGSVPDAGVSEGSEPDVQPVEVHLAEEITIDHPCYNMIGACFGAVITDLEPALDVAPNVSPDNPIEFEFRLGEPSSEHATSLRYEDATLSALPLELRRAVAENGEGVSVVSVTIPGGGRAQQLFAVEFGTIGPGSGPLVWQGLAACEDATFVEEAARATALSCRGPVTIYASDLRRPVDTSTHVGDGWFYLKLPDRS